MSTTAVFLALQAGVIAWILVVRRLTAKSWEARAAAADVQTGDVGAIGLAAALFGLWLFVAVVRSLFGLFFSGFSMRMARASPDSSRN